MKSTMSEEKPPPNPPPRPGVEPAVSLAVQVLWGMPGYMRDTIKSKRGTPPIVSRRDKKLNDYCVSRLSNHINVPPHEELPHCG